MKKLKLKTLSQTLQTGLGVFLVTGLTGCDSISNDCDKYNPAYPTPKKLDDCKSSRTQIIPTSSGYFASDLSESHGG